MFDRFFLHVFMRSSNTMINGGGAKYPRPGFVEYINCYYIILAAVRRTISESASPLLIKSEFDPRIYDPHSLCTVMYSC